MAEQTSIHSHKFYKLNKADEYLWVYNLSYATTTQEIVNYFEELVGPIEFFTMYLDDNFLCKAEMIFRCAEDARKALLLYDGTELHGHRMVLKLFVNGHRIHPEQIVFPGSIIHLSAVSEARLLTDDFLEYFPNDTNLDWFSGEGSEMFVPLEQYLPRVESFGKSEDDPSDSSGQNHVCLFVTNLQYSITAEQLLEFFETTVGPVKSIGMYLDDKGFLCGKAQVIFHHPDDFYKALLCCNETRLNGRMMILKLYVNGRRVRANQTVLPGSSFADDWMRPHAFFFSLPSVNCMAENFPDEPTLGPFTMPTIKDEVDHIHLEGPDIPPFLPLVFVKDCIRPYMSPAFE